MMKRFFSLLILTLMYLITEPLFALGSEINSMNIILNTIQGASKCLHYRITGMCFWLRCSIAECHIENTLKIDQYLPDAVISAYTHHDNNPWLLANTTLDPEAYLAGKKEVQTLAHFNMADGNSPQNSKRDLNNHFHEIDIIGNPALPIFSRSGVMLQSTAKPFVPYYSSLLDAYAWRFPAMERFYPQSLIPGLHDIGTFLLHDWGQLFPRNGYVNQPDDAKAGAVAAQRAADIITKSGQPHLYFPLSNSCGDHCSADPVKENSPQVKYQMIYPKAENECAVFGESDIGSMHPWENDAAQTGHNRYVWVMWRHYHGCIQDDGAKYLGSISF